MKREWARNIYSRVIIWVSTYSVKLFCQNMTAYSVALWHYWPVFTLPVCVSVEFGTLVKIYSAHSEKCVSMFSVIMNTTYERASAGACKHSGTVTSNPRDYTTKLPTWGFADVNVTYNPSTRFLLTCKAHVRKATELCLSIFISFIIYNKNNALTLLHILSLSPSISVYISVYPSFIN